MKIEETVVKKNQEVAPDHYVLELSLKNRTPAILPGQFANVFLPSDAHLLPRPFSVLDVSKDSVSLLYKIFGEGTRLLSELNVGEALRLLMPLGNQFPELETRDTVLISGGIGVVPLYYFAKHRFDKEGALQGVRVYLGAKDKSEIVYENEFKSLGCDVVVATDNGSKGFSGNCLEAYLADVENRAIQTKTLFSCGPHPLLRAVANFGESKGIATYLAVEEVMGCGFGACVGCAIKTRDGTHTMPFKLVCKDGPIFKSTDIDWSH